MFGIRNLFLASVIFLQFSSDQKSGEPVEGQKGFCSTFVINGKEVKTYTLGSSDSIVLGWLKHTGKPHKSFKSFMGASADKFSLVTNAGMFHPNRQPVGLYIQNDSTYVQLDTNSGGGNFYMKPNGVFGMMSTGPWIGTTEQYRLTQPELKLATQSGPMLVIGDSIHHRFNINSPNKNTRSGVGIDRNNRVVFAIAYKNITFHELATVFRDSLRCSNALYLDGAISRMYLKTENCSDTFTGGSFGPIIGVYTK